jgi:hypothetical protein
VISSDCEIPSKKRVVYVKHFQSCEAKSNENSKLFVDYHKNSTANVHFTDFEYLTMIYCRLFGLKRSCRWEVGLMLEVDGEIE